MTVGKVSLAKEHIQEVIDVVRKATRLDSKTAFAIHLYLHAVVHGKDPTAVAAGFMASQYLDREGSTLTPPTDCVVGILVSLHGFEKVAEWTDEEYREALSNIDADDALPAALKYLEQEDTLNDEKGKVEEDAIDKIMGGLPSDMTKH